MSERPTPETDAFVAALNDEWDVEFAALTSHAKKLERERDEAREALREHNERLLTQAHKLREAVLALRGRAMERYIDNQRLASDARMAAFACKADLFECMATVQSGMVRALDDVVQAMDHLASEEAVK